MPRIRDSSASYRVQYIVHNEYIVARVLYCEHKSNLITRKY